MFIDILTDAYNFGDFAILDRSCWDLEVKITKEQKTNELNKKVVAKSLRLLATILTNCCRVG